MFRRHRHYIREVFEKEKALAEAAVLVPLLLYLLLSLFVDLDAAPAWIWLARGLLGWIAVALVFILAVAPVIQYRQDLRRLNHTAMVKQSDKALRAISTFCRAARRSRGSPTRQGHALLDALIVFWSVSHAARGTFSGVPSALARTAETWGSETPEITFDNPFAPTKITLRLRSGFVLTKRI